MKKLMMSAILLTSFNASAIDFDVNVTTCGVAGTQNDLGTLCGQLKQEIKDLVGEDLPDADIGEYGTGMANANGFAYKGLGSDYSNNFDYFVIRAAAGGAVDGDMDDAENADGVGIGASATIGINLDLLPVDKIGPVDLGKMDLFISMFSYDIDNDIDDNTNASGEISSFSVMARYQIVDGKEFIAGNMLEWGGIFLHTGFQRSSWDATIKATFDDETAEISGAQATFSDSQAKLTLETTTTTIPIEVSTYLRAGYIFTFFGGAGFDLVSGTSEVDIDLGGDISGTSGFDAELTAGDSASGDADATNFRGFFGAQFNIPFVSVYAQMNKGLGNDLVGVNAGVKILW